LTDEIRRPPSLAAHLPALRIHQLGNADRDRLGEHLLRLDSHDRAMRFMRAMSDRGLASFVAALDFGAATRLGLLTPHGELVALAEGFTYAVGARTDMEVAFSTDASWRRCGLATGLFDAMARLARATGGRLRGPAVSQPQYRDAPSVEGRGCSGVRRLGGNHRGLALRRDIACAPLAAVAPARCCFDGTRWRPLVVQGFGRRSPAASR
jgi:GNAT superfamily N-acetyltransferase